MKYLLDTNMCIFLSKNHPKVLGKYEENESDGIAISSITVAELFYGAAYSARPVENREIFHQFFTGFTLLDFGVEAAAQYGEVCADLRRKGTPIGRMDTLIAAHAKSAGLVVVTKNTREFSRVQGLRLEDWTR